MASKLQLHVFHNDIYPRRLFIVKGKGASNYIKDNFKTLEGEKIKNDVTGAVAWVQQGTVEFKDGTYGYLMCIQERMNVSFIAHEATHVAFELFKDIGAYADTENQEPFSYLVGWIADCIYQVVTNKIRDKNGKIQNRSESNDIIK